MHYYKITIQYEGTSYAGFQWQNGIQTIQSEFNKSLSKLISGKFTTMAASRTDTGVHAVEQIVKISSIDLIELSTFLEILKNELPPQIKCIDIKPCDGFFKPAASAISKEYRYFFTNKKQVAKDEMRFIANVSNPLDLGAMIICVHALIGTHDFFNFYSSGSNVKSTIRSISTCELSVVNPHDIFKGQVLFPLPGDLNSCYQFKIEANGFLKQMIRHIVSALWMVGSGKISTDEFMTLLNGPANPNQLWKVAGPNGLFLYRVNYPD